MSDLAETRTIEHITIKYGELWEVRCPYCGTPLQTMRAVDDTPEGRLLKLIRKDTYRQVRIQMDDGSTHVSYLCRDCAVVGDTLPLNLLYEADVAVFAALGTPLSEKDANRKPKRIVGFEKV